MTGERTDPAHVGMTEFQREVEIVGERIKQAVEETIDSGWYVLGERVRRFERRFANFVNCRHGIGVNSGTDAIALGLRALGVDPGDEVVTVSHTATATAAAIRLVGAEPVYVDVDPESMVMVPGAVDAVLSPNTAAVVPVHLYGQPVRMDELRKVVARHEAPILEDCSQAHGATWQGDPVGSFGDIAAFSCYPTKNLGAYGDAGIVTTDDPDLAANVRRYRQYGWEDKYVPRSTGQNSRLDEIQAAILNEKLDFLEPWNEQRRRNAGVYDQMLGDGPVQTPTSQDSARHVFHLYVIQTDARDDLRDHLERHGIETQIHYPIPVHRQTGYDAPVSLPVTERLCDQILSLPVHPFLTEEEVQYVGESIAEFY